jgi:hypothetical protein
MWPSTYSPASRNVEQDRALAAEVVPTRERHQAVEMIHGDHAGQVDGILGGAELRRIAELRLREIANRGVHLDRGRDDVDPFVHPFQADGLRPQDSAMVRSVTGWSCRQVLRTKRPPQAHAVGRDRRVGSSRCAYHAD